MIGNKLKTFRSNPSLHQKGPQIQEVIKTEVLVEIHKFLEHRNWNL